MQDENPSEKKWVHVLLKGERVANMGKEPENAPDSYVQAFQAKNLDALCIPILEFNFKNLDKLAQIVNAAIENSNLVGQKIGLVLTSPRVVEAVARALGSRIGLLKAVNSQLIFVVGHRTGMECTTKLGLCWNQESYLSGNSSTLSSVIKSTCAGFNQPVRLIYPKSALADCTIEEALADTRDVDIDSMIAYDTIGVQDVKNCVTRLLMSYLTDSFKGHESELALNLNFVFFSPSGVDCLLEGVDLQDLVTYLIDNVPKVASVAIRFSCIGRTTENALRRRGLEPLCVADKPTAQSLVDDILIKSSIL